MTRFAFRGRLHAANHLRRVLVPGLLGLFLLIWAGEAFARPDWLIPYGREFWQTATTTEARRLLSADSSRRPAHAPADLGLAIDRVRHAFQSDGISNSWRVTDPTFQVRLDGAGIAFQSGAAADSVAVHLKTHAIATTGQGLQGFDSDLAVTPWLVTGNVAQRRLKSKVPLVEHVQARGAGLEVTWVIKQFPASREDLLIDWEITGGGSTKPTDGGWRLFGSNSNSIIKVGLATAVDSKGRRLRLKMLRTPTGFRITVPASFLQTAAYPVAVDPLISAEFNLDQPVTRPSPSAQFAPAIASDGTNYLVVWHDNRNGSRLNVFGARVSASGTILDPSGFAVTTGTNDQWYPAIAFNGTNYLVAWQDARNGNQDIYASRVTTAGVVLETNGLPVVTVGYDQRLPVVASLNGDFLVAWQDGRNGTANQDVYAARIRGAGLLIETNGFAVSSAANSQSAPSLGVVGTNYVAAWHDFRSGVSLDVYAARITASGTVLDSNGIAVSAASGDQWNVSIAGNGGTGLIVWQDGRNGTNDDLFGARINANGTVLDPGGLAINQQTGQQRYPAVTAVGSDFYVAWQDNRGGVDFDLYGTTVSASTGVPASTDGTLLSSAVNDQRYPALARAGNQLLVVWEDIRNGSNAEIYGSRIDATGTSLDSGNLLISTVANSQDSPAVAGNGSLYLAVWRDYRNDPLGDIYGSRIAADGTVMDPAGIAICTATNYQQAPSVASSGTDFLVVWQDFRNGVHDDVMGSRVTAAGVVQDPNGLQITTALGAQRQPSVAGTTNGYLVVWQDSRSVNGLDIYGARVNPDGSVRDANGLPICAVIGDQKAPAVAGLNESYFVAWEDYRSGLSNRVYGTRVDWNGTIAFSDGFPLSSIAGEQRASRVAASTNLFFVVWQGATNGTSFDIFGTRVTATGIVMDTNSISISSATGDQTRPVIASKQADFMVVWEDQRVSGKTNLYSTRITSNGSVLEPTGALTAPAAGNFRTPVLANVGPDYLLAYQTWDAGNVPRIRGVMQFPAAEPTISLSPGAAQFIAGAGPVAVDNAAVLVDGGSANYESGTLTIDITANGTTDDRLAIIAQGAGPGQIGVNGNQVYFGGTLIGFETGGTSGNSALLVIFNSATTPDAVQALARAISFNNVNSLPFTQPRTIRFTLNLIAGAGQSTTRVVNVIDSGSVPVIVTQPASQTSASGAAITLSVVASGSQPITYQWLFNGVAIAGATNATYSIPSLQAATAGTYTVAVANTYDSIVSDAAIVSSFDIAMYAGLTLGGPVGATYLVEYRPAFGDQNSWLTLTNITLTTTPMLFFDTASGVENQRFYRATRQQ